MFYANKYIIEIINKNTFLNLSKKMYDQVYLNY